MSFIEPSIQSLIQTKNLADIETQATRLDSTEPNSLGEVVFSPQNTIYKTAKNAATLIAISMCASHSWANAIIDDETSANSSVSGYVTSVPFTSHEQLTITTPSANLAWLASFYKTSSLSDSASEIYPLVQGIAQIFKQKDYVSVDNILDTAPIDSLSNTVMITLVRTTFPAKNKLRNWHKCLNKVSKQLSARDQNAGILLRGLS